MKIRAPVLCASLAAAAFGCSKSSDTRRCTPPPANDMFWTLDVTNASAVAGEIADLRLVEGPTVLFCSSAIVPAGGSLGFSSDAFGPVGNANLELIVSSNGTFDGSAHHYSFVQGADGALSGGENCAIPYHWDVTMDFSSATETSVTWLPGAACPGQ